MDPPSANEAAFIAAAVFCLNQTRALPPLRIAAPAPAAGAPPSPPGAGRWHPARSCWPSPPRDSDSAALAALPNVLAQSLVLGPSRPRCQDSAADLVPRAALAASCCPEEPVNPGLESVVPGVVTAGGLDDDLILWRRGYFLRPGSPRGEGGDSSPDDTDARPRCAHSCSEVGTRGVAAWVRDTLSVGAVLPPAAAVLESLARAPGFGAQRRLLVPAVPGLAGLLRSELAALESRGNDAVHASVAGDWAATTAVLSTLTRLVTDAGARRAMADSGCSDLARWATRLAGGDPSRREELKAATTLAFYLRSISSSRLALEGEATG